MKKSILVFLLIGICTYGFAQHLGTEVIVKVENVGSTDGQMMFALFNTESSFLKDALKGGKQTIDGTTVEFSFQDVKAGVYAISIFHDKNANGELDTNFMGIPKEPYGFSNNAKGMFGPPSFEDCQFEIKQEQKTILIRL